MKEPAAWSPTELEQRMLDAARGEHIPPELRARIASALPPASAPRPTAANPLPSPPMAAGGLWFAKAKLWGSLTLVALAGAAGWSAWGKSTARRRALEPRPSIATTAAPAQLASHITPATDHPLELASQFTTATVHQPKPAQPASQVLLATDHQTKLPSQVTAATDHPLEPASQVTAATEHQPKLASQVMPTTGAQLAPVAPEPTLAHARAGAPQPRARAAASLQEELALLDRARSALRAGDSQRALGLLDDHAQRFSHGTLEPEAEVLRIEALVASGATRRAASLAQAFLRSHPAHPLAEHVSTLVARR